MLKVLSLLLPVLVIAGCSNVGDTNPVSPEAMSKMRENQANERASFKPDVSRKGGQ